MSSYELIRGNFQKTGKKTTPHFALKAALTLLAVLLLISIACGTAAAADANQVSTITVCGSGSGEGSAAGGVNWGAVTGWGSGCERKAGSSAVYGAILTPLVSAANTAGTPKVTFTFPSASVKSVTDRKGAVVTTGTKGTVDGCSYTLTVKPDSANAYTFTISNYLDTNTRDNYYGGLGPFTPTVTLSSMNLLAKNVNIPVSPSSISVSNVANTVSGSIISSGTSGANAGNWIKNGAAEEGPQGIQPTNIAGTSAVPSTSSPAYISASHAAYKIDETDSNKFVYQVSDICGSPLILKSSKVDTGVILNPELADEAVVSMAGNDVRIIEDSETGKIYLQFWYSSSAVSRPITAKIYNLLSADGVTVPIDRLVVHMHDNVFFEDQLNSITNVFQSGGYTFASNGVYYLSGHVQLKGPLTIPAGVDIKLCLVGFNVTAAANTPAFIVSGGNLTIYADGDEKVGTIIANGTAEAVSVSSGTFTLKDGTVLAASGDAVSVTGGSFTMNGGTVTGAAAGKYGITVGNGASSFTFTGGKVTGNDKGISSAININVSGTPAVSGNTNGNIALASGKVLNLIGALKSGASLTVDGADSTYASADLTTGWSEYMKEVSGTEPYRYIKSTAAGYTPYVTDAGEIRFEAGGLKGDYEIIENGTTQLSGGQGFKLDTANAVYYLSRDVILEDELNITADGTTLYLNGYTLTAASGKSVINVTAGTLSIGDSSADLGGTVKGDGAAAVTVSGAGTLTLNSGAVDAAAGYPALSITAGTAELAGGIVKAADSNAASVTGGELRVTGGTVDGNNAAADAVTVTGSAELNVTGGKITRSGAYGINYTAAADGFTFTGGTVSSNAKGIYSAANISIKDTPAAAGNTEGNIYLAEGKFLNLTGALTKAASISMNLTETAASEEHIFTAHWSEYMGTASEAEETLGTQPHQYFLSDARGYNAVASDDGLEVVIKEGGFGTTHYHDFGTEDEIIFDQILNSASNVKTGDVILTKSGNYTLDADLQLKGNVTIPEGVTVLLCLDGFKLTAEENRNLFDVKGNLTLFDCRAESTGGFFGNLSTAAVADHSGNGTAVYVDGGNFILESGIIKDFIGSNGAAVYVDSGKFTAKGGKITGNTGDSAVYIKNSAVFNVEGTPVIKGNTAENIHLETGAEITISGELKDGAELCVNASEGAAAGTVFTSGWETAMSEKDPAQYIKADDVLLLAVKDASAADEVKFESQSVAYKLLKGTTVEFTDGSRFGYAGVNPLSIDLWDSRAEGAKGFGVWYNKSTQALVLEIPQDITDSIINLGVAGNKVPVSLESYNYLTETAGNVNATGIWNGTGVIPVEIGGESLNVTLEHKGDVKYFGIPTIRNIGGIELIMAADDISVYKDGVLLTKGTDYTIGTEFDGRKEIILTNPDADAVYRYEYLGKQLGDADQSGEVDALDGSAVLSSVLDTHAVDTNALLYADVNGNGVVNVMDARIIARWTVGLI